eukprot:jgi/Hompol1/2802/HPOL_006169-RA
MAELGNLYLGRKTILKRAVEQKPDLKHNVASFMCDQLSVIAQTVCSHGNFDLARKLMEQSESAIDGELQEKLPRAQFENLMSVLQINLAKARSLNVRHELKLDILMASLSHLEEYAVEIVIKGALASMQTGLTEAIEAFPRLLQLVEVYPETRVAFSESIANVFPGAVHLPLQISAAQLRYTDISTVSSAQVADLLRHVADPGTNRVLLELRRLLSSRQVLIDWLEQADILLSYGNVKYIRKHFNEALSPYLNLDQSAGVNLAELRDLRARIIQICGENGEKLELDMDAARSALNGIKGLVPPKPATAVVSEALPTSLAYYSTWLANYAWDGLTETRIEVPGQYEQIKRPFSALDIVYITMVHPS